MATGCLLPTSHEWTERHSTQLYSKPKERSERAKHGQGYAALYNINGSRRLTTDQQVRLRAACLDGNTGKEALG